MKIPSDNYVSDARKTYATKAVAGFKGAIASTRRVEKYLTPQTGAVRLEACKGMPADGEQTIRTQAITFDQLWDICSTMVAYKSRSNGRYAKNATKGQLQAKGTPDKFGRKERALSKVAATCDRLTHTKKLLGQLCAELVQCEKPPLREQLIEDITVLCEREGIRGVPYFMTDLSEITNASQAVAYAATLYAMFPLCGRGFKKYYLNPRIKQVRREWGLERSARPETIQTISDKYREIV